MVCGDPSDPTGSGCDEVLRDVWRFLDNEMEPENRAAIQRHLDECSPCLDEARDDLALKHLLHEKCGGDRAPEALRSRLVARLARVSAALEGEQASVRVATMSIRVTTD